MSRVFILAARRTMISPKGGALFQTPFQALTASVIHAVLADANVQPEQVEDLFLGNALGAGGNPARVAALASGLLWSTPAVSIDTQCCSGLDAIALAVDRIRAGSVHVLLAGGAESASQAPHRLRRSQLAVRPGATSSEATLHAYEEADFTPWPEDEPSMVESARALSKQLADPDAEHAWALRSHHRAKAASHPERVSAGRLGGRDTYTRALRLEACRRGATHPIHNPTTMAPLADGAAMILLVSEATLREWLSTREHALMATPAPIPVISEVLATCQLGGDPFAPGLATNGLKAWLDRLRAEHGEPACVQLMESFAAQTLLNMNALALDPGRVNADGGLLAMGHPIAASGAVLAARLHHRLRINDWGVALIPAAGGVASGLALRRVSAP